MSQTLCLLEPVPLDPGMDDVVDEFVIEDRELAIIDRLIGTGFGMSRAEVIKGVLEHSLLRHESIGRCDLCGEVDHHLRQGACPGCRNKYGLPDSAELTITLPEALS